MISTGLLFQTNLYSVGFFVEPTVVQTTSPSEKIFTEEIFGPVVTAYVYKDADCLKTLNNVSTGEYLG